MEPVNINQIKNSMQTGSALRAQNIRNTEAQAETRKVQQDTRAQENSKAQENAGKAAGQVEDSAAKGIYGDVLDISEDGDTVTARPEALQKLDDGIVMLRSDSNEEKLETIEKQREAAERREEIADALAAKAEESREAREKVREENQQANEDESENTAQYNSLSGYPDNMVETLYRQGKIDSNTYNMEIGRRERLDEMRGTDEKTETEEKVENNTAFNEQMGRVNAQAQEDERTSEALITAAENGRVDLMKDIIENTTN
ncbi:MAG: hypothetical protein J5509_08755 [Lachnospiraceae bacterium]|nr:hypothetical protein [Lachnospiraceae bacterium]